MAIQSFAGKASEDICNDRNSRTARTLLPVELHFKARIKLARIAASTNINDLAGLPGNRFEFLKGDRVGRYSIRINDKYRICFRWENNNALDVEIVDYH